MATTDRLAQGIQKNMERSNLLSRASAILAIMMTLGLSGVGRAEEPDVSAVKEAEDEKDAKIAALEEKVDVLAEEMGRLNAVFAVPEEVALESFSGLGPAASKVYKRESGLSIGGYGEVRLRSFVNQGDDDQDDVFDALRAVLYVGYKFDDKWVLNSELEFEHGGDGGGGSVSTEFVTIDYLYRDELNARAGLLLIPMGFVNEIHEPTFFYGAERPEVERLILPSTWRENGAGIFGTLAERVHYRMYVVNGFDGQDFTTSGLRGGRQKGSRAISNDFAFVGRVDVDVADGLLIGGSVYTGQTGQERDNTYAVDGNPLNDETADLPDAQIHIYEIHAQYKGYGLSLRGLWTQAFINETGKLNRDLNNGLGLVDDGAGGLERGLLSATSAIANRMDGFYVEAAYDVLPLLCDSKASLEPYFRYEMYDTQKSVQDAGVGYARDRTKDVKLYVAGLQFKPIPQVVFKVDYRHFDPRSGDPADQIQGLVGYVF